MYDIEYNYNVGQTVWTKNGNSVVECRVTQITLEVDPDETEGLIERKTYHLDIVHDMYCTIILRLEEDVFETAEDAILDVPSTPLSVYSIAYEFAVDDIVWTHENHCDVECIVNQISFNINSLKTDVVYHLLPLNGEHSLLYKLANVVFATQQEALDAIAAIITPTPTISITASATPMATPPNTQTATPTVTPTQTVTPNPTVTPTPSG